LERIFLQANLNYCLLIEQFFNKDFYIEYFFEF